MLSVSPLRMLMVICLTVLAGFLPSISVLTMQTIINGLQKENVLIQQILIFCGFYLLLDILNSVIIKWVSLYSFIIEKKSSLAVSLMILEKTKVLELHDFECMDTYDLIQRAQNESNGKIYAYFTSFLTMLQALITIFSSFYLIKKWSILIIIIIAFLTLIRMLFLVSQGKEKYSILRQRTHKERKKWYYQYLLTNDIAFKEIKMYDLYNYFIDKFKTLSLSFFNQDKELFQKQQLIDFGFTVLDCILSGVFFCALVVSCKMGKLLVGDVVAYMRIISNIKNNIEYFCLQVVAIWENTLYISQLFELQDIKSAKLNESHMIEIDKIKYIELRHVSYRYEGSVDYNLKNINIIFERDIVTYLVGKNGSGKTTLVKLICGYYNDYEGQILVNGIDLRKINIKQYRKKLGILFQDFMMYELSLRENVILSNLSCDQDEKKIFRTLQAVGFTKYSDIDMQLGNWFDDGQQLSRGEWLKVALARAFIKDADVYIADEPNSALDPISESEIMKYYKALVKKKLGIIITHKMTNGATFGGRIIVMNEGEIIDMGSHEKLYRNCPLYFELFTLSQN